MSLSPVEICNLALGWLGGNLIISFEDETVEAKLCKANYESIRDTVLEEREWTFAVKRLELAALTETPTYGFDRAFQIPAEVIRILQVSGGVDEGATVDGSFKSATRGGTGIGRESRIEWLREGDQIVANNAERVFCRAIVRIEDSTKFMASFTQALAARLAMDLAIPLTNSANLQTQMAQMYGEKLAIAAATDGMQGRSYNVRSDAFTVVR